MTWTRFRKTSKQLEVENRYGKIRYRRNKIQVDEAEREINDFERVPSDGEQVSGTEGPSDGEGFRTG